MGTRKSDRRAASGGKSKSLQALYAKYRKQFTAADLQKYTEVEQGVPLEQVIAEMEAIHRAEQARLRRRSK